MSCHHDPLHCILPPYVLDHMANSTGRRFASWRSRRSRGPQHCEPPARHWRRLPAMTAVPSADKKKERVIYDMPGPGILVPARQARAREKADPKSSDPAVNEAYDDSGATYDFYKKLFNRNSLDDQRHAADLERPSGQEATTTRSGTANRWPTATATGRCSSASRSRSMSSATS